MEPRTLLKALMDAKELNPNSLARALNNKPPQPQIYRFLEGISKEPKRSTMEPIAAYFQVPVDAFFDPSIAETVAAERGFIRMTEPQPAKQQPSEMPPFTGFTYSDTKLSLAPVVEWARLGTDLYKGIEEFNQATTERLPFTTKKRVGINCKFVRLESDSHAPRIMPGDMILIDPDNTQPAMDELALFSLPNGDHILLRYRDTVDGFEGYDERGRVLDKVRHGIQVAGVFVLFLRENA